MSALAETLEWLVGIPSVTGDEGRICTQIAARLLPSYEKPDVVRIGNSLVVGRHSGRPLVLLVGHIDTVPGQGQPAAHIVDGRMHGLGTTDMKGGVAVMIHLLEAVHPGPYDVIGIFYDGEEGPAANNGLEQVLDRAEWLREAFFAVVLEPTDRQLQVGCNGTMNADVVFMGRSAHSARPWLGENAISKAGQFLSDLHERMPQSMMIDGLDYKEVMSVTRAEGGIANNVIPSEFKLNVNYRFSPAKSIDEAEAYLRSECAAADRVDITDAAPAGPVDVSHPLIELLRRASGALVTAKQGWTDVARLGAEGVAAVNFGPGDTALAHHFDESVALDDLDFAYGALYEMLTIEK